MKRFTPLVLAASATLAVFAIALFGLPWVRESSRSLRFDFIVLLAWAVSAVTAGWLQAELVLPSPKATSDAERERIRAALQAGREDGQAGRASMTEGLRLRNVLRSVLVLAAVGANLFLSNLAAGDFWFGHYQRLGLYTSALRSERAETRRWAVRKVADLATPVLRDGIRAIAPLMEDPDEEVRSDAIAALGYVGRRMRLSIATLERETGTAGRWEPSALADVEEVLGAPEDRIPAATGLARRAWISAAGALGRPGAVAILGEIVASPDSTRDDVVTAVTALADLSGPAVLPALRPALASPDPDVRAYAAWGIGIVTSAYVAWNARVADADPEFRRTEEEVAASLPRLGTAAICAYLRSFHEIADVRLTRGLIEVARSPVFGERCVRVERPAWFGRPEVVSGDEDVADLVIAAMAVVAVGNDALAAFLEKASTDPAYSEARRMQLSRILQDSRTAGR